MNFNKSLFEIFKRAIKELGIGKTDFNSFKDACENTRYRNIPEQVKDDYDSFIEKLKTSDLSTEPIKDKNDTTNEVETFSEEDLEETYHDDLSKEIKKYKKFVITTAVVDKEVNVDFLNSIKNYAKRNNALVLILPSDIRNQKDEDDDTPVMKLDIRLRDFKIVYKDVYLNNNLCVCSIKTSAKQIKTLTGLDRIATKKDASMIIASTKLFEDNVPIRTGNVPRRVVTTGAITIDNYDTDRYMSKRTAYIAKEDHMYGAVVVDIVDERYFHMRLVEGSDSYTFTDLGIEYKPDGSIQRLENNIMIMGDSHVDVLNTKLHKDVMKSISELNVSTVVLHDIFNATSVTHHDKGKNLTKAVKANEDRNSLEKEGLELKEYLEDVEKQVDKVIIVKSNHDQHLETYLEEGRYIGDPTNTYIAHKLAIAYMDGEDPLKYLEEDLLGLESDKIRWLDINDECKLFGVAIDSHGAKGTNGARASLAQYDKAVGNVVIGHTHSAKRIRRACSVGTVSMLLQDYNAGGLSTWSMTTCLIHSNGTKSLIHYIIDENGNYRYKV